MEGALKPQAGQQRKPWSIQNTPAGWVPTRLTPQPGQGRGALRWGGCLYKPSAKSQYAQHTQKQAQLLDGGQITAA